MPSTLYETCKQEIDSVLTGEKKTNRKDGSTPTSVIGALPHLDPKLCKHCLKKLTTKEMWLLNGYCTECWILHGMLGTERPFA